MGNLFHFINDAGLIGWLIILVGFTSVAITIERFYVLYIRYGMKSEEFMTKIQSLILSKKFEEALSVCSSLSDKPLASAFKTILEKSDREDDAIFQAHDIALSETVPLVTKRLHYLSMLANVATLMGLLGTIHGLIVSFEAVAQADPSQKQTMLAHGISISMYTTALGLVVAIPAMVFYSFLVSKQNSTTEVLTEKCGKLTELLTGAYIPNINRQTIYPDDLARERAAGGIKAPPSSMKAS